MELMKFKLNNNRKISINYYKVQTKRKNMHNSLETFSIKWIQLAISISNNKIII